MSKKKNRIILIFMYVILCILKIISISKIQGPSCFGDEYLYKIMAQDLLNQGYYTNFQYPLGYPAVLSIAFIFKNYFYEAMQIINVIITSMTVFIVWKIAKLYLEDKKAMMCTLFSCLVPFHYMLPKYIMSENLYYPLFLLGTYYLLKSWKTNRKKDIILFGVSLGLMNLTRYISLVVSIVFIFVWIIDINNKIRIKINYINLKKVWILLLAYLVTYSPWLIMGLSNGNTIIEVLGFSITPINTMGIENYNNLQSFGMWAIFYISYLIIMIAPFLNIIILTPYIIYKNKINELEMKLISAVLFLTGALGFVATRHSSKCHYNYPIPAYIIGRYIMFVGILWIIVWWVIQNKVDSYKEKNMILFSSIISSLFIIGSMLIIIYRKVFRVSDSFILGLNGVDAYYLKSNTNQKILLLFLLINIIMLILKNKYYKRVLYSLIIFVMSINSISSINVTNSNVKHVREISNKYYDIKINNFNDNFIIYDDIGLNDLEYGMKFWGIEDNLIIKNKDEFTISEKLDNGIIITNKRITNNALDKYIVDGMDYYIYSTPINIKMNICEVYPNVIEVSKGFNVQNDGSSALVLKVDDYIYGAYLYIDDEKVDLLSSNNEGMVSCKVPDKYFKNKENIKVQIKFDQINGEYIESNIINIPINN